MYFDLALLREYRALLREYRALLRECRALLRDYRALLREYRALLREYRALLNECRVLRDEWSSTLCMHFDCTDICQSVYDIIHVCILTLQTWLFINNFDFTKTYQFNSHPPKDGKIAL